MPTKDEPSGRSGGAGEREWAGDALLVVRKHVAASPEAVFAAWTDPESLRVWMCPMDVEEARAELDVRVGGRFRIDMIAGDEVYRHTGEYVEVDPPRRLAFTWTSPATNERPSRVTVQLEPTETGTEVVLTHERLPDRRSAERHEAGWASILDKLAKEM